MISGEVVSIDDKNYVVKDSENKEIRVEANSMTLDEGIEVGDKAEVRYSADDKPILSERCVGPESRFEEPKVECQKKER